MIICAAEAYPDLWIHVDAAWAGVALACPEYRDRAHLTAINQHAHSFCTNFHKVHFLLASPFLCLISYIIPPFPPVGPHKL
jgi:glutamate/tyrosine decarboxylase-like PLP-dependent enzyme